MTQKGEAQIEAKLVSTLLLTLRYGLLCQGVHPHRYTEVLQSIEELTEGFELSEADAFLLRQLVNESF